ncbi:hypothetical protein CEXT_196551 [Caerostris extrusa]|uniref:Uncharacterized protein n=1 Tax=Caerostris extrusa TaxID=172846 RepID=A0AAV4S6K6_CAEEX|nr:hypothetical protein CEXT_196551 [Caerostris extrusa]
MDANTAEDAAETEKQLKIKSALSAPGAEFVPNPLSDILPRNPMMQTFFADSIVLVPDEIGKHISIL